MSSVGQVGALWREGPLSFEISTAVSYTRAMSHLNEINCHTEKTSIDLPMGQSYPFLPCRTPTINDFPWASQPTKKNG